MQQLKEESKSKVDGIVDELMEEIHDKDLQLSSRKDILSLIEDQMNENMDAAANTHTTTIQYNRHKGWKSLCSKHT